MQIKLGTYRILHHIYMQIKLGTYRIIYHIYMQRLCRDYMQIKLGYLLFLRFSI